MSPRLRQQTETTNSSAPKFAPLEEAILDSLGELSVSSSSGGKATSGVHIGNLIEDLNSKYSQSIDSPGVEFIDCAINGLVRGGQIKVRPLGQDRMDAGGGLLLERAPRGACQSVFVDQLIELASPPPSFQVVSYPAGSWHHNNNKSKSTTLDSGIQSLLMVNRTACSSSSSANRGNMSPTATSGDDDQQQQQQQLQQRQSRLRKNGAQVVVERRGFSLTRSFSFRSKKMPLAQPPPQQQHQTIAGDSRWSGDDERREAKRQEPERSLTSLFRSKSMRIISSGKSDRFKSSVSKSAPQTHDASNDSQTKPIPSNCDAAKKNTCTRPNPITIDYLATAQPHKRSLSLRRNSLLSESTGTKDDPSASGKLVLFLRKLFSGGRRARSAAPPVNRLFRPMAESQATTPAGGRDASNQFASYSDCNKSQLKRHLTMTASTRAGHTQVQSVHGKAKSLLHHHQNNSTSSNSPTDSTSPNSSGSNSLIEILDCSRAVNNTRRPLRREAIEPLAGANRARWRLVKRSESNLSHDSEASCSTTKSTASQQLRRHLDEAYKRHRKCTNQRDKDFIDSIQVLRQASRHALQNSRSSLKSRQAKSTGTKSATSEDTASSFGSSCCPSAARDEQQLSPKSGEPLALYRSPTYPEEEDDYEASRGNHRALTSNGQTTVYQLQPEQPELDLIQHQQLVASTKSNGTAEGKSVPSGQHQDQEQRINGDACCLCNSYLDAAARLSSCPLSACYPPPATNVPLPTTCCCFTSPASQPMQLHQHEQQTNKLATHAALTSYHNPLMATTINPPDFCCPLWRSFMYNYCPATQESAPFYAPPALPPLHQPLMQQVVNVANGGQQQHQQQQQQRLVDNYHHHQQQNQHNTTIDLKIEIGADFNSAVDKQQVKLERVSSKKRKQTKTAQSRRLLKQTDQPEGKAACDDYHGDQVEAVDSLETSELTSSSLDISNEASGTEATSSLFGDESMVMMNSDNTIKMDDQVTGDALTCLATSRSCCAGDADGAPSDSLAPSAASGSACDSLQSNDQSL